MEHATPPPPGCVISAVLFFWKSNFSGHATPTVVSLVPCFSFGKATFQGMRPPGCVISAVLFFWKSNFSGHATPPPPPPVVSSVPHFCFRKQHNVFCWNAVVGACLCPTQVSTIIIGKETHCPMNNRSEGFARWCQQSEMYGDKETKSARGPQEGVMER